MSPTLPSHSGERRDRGDRKRPKVLAGAIPTIQIRSLGRIIRRQILRLDCHPGEEPRGRSDCAFLSSCAPEHQVARHTHAFRARPQADVAGTETA